MLSPAEGFNLVKLKPPAILTSKVIATKRMRDHARILKESLDQAVNTLKNLDYLHKDAAVLSRFLYRSYGVNRKDKGFQHLKMVMQCLNKYLKMGVQQDMELLMDSIPACKPTNLTYLPNRATLSWILARIQAFAVLFQRVYILTKGAGRYIIQRLRLGWFPVTLMFGLGLAARIHVLSRYLVLNAVSWHKNIVAIVRAFPKVAYDPLKDFPQDLREWLGGLDEMTAPTQRPSSTIDLVFDLIDLTSQDNGDEEVEIINLKEMFSSAINEDDDIQRLLEVVAIDNTEESLRLNVKQEEAEEEDLGVSVQEEAKIEAGKISSKRKKNKNSKIKRRKLDDFPKNKTVVVESDEDIGVIEVINAIA